MKDILLDVINGNLLNMQMLISYTQAICVLQYRKVQHHIVFLPQHLLQTNGYYTWYNMVKLLDLIW